MFLQKKKIFHLKNVIVILFLFSAQISYIKPIHFWELEMNAHWPMVRKVFADTIPNALGYSKAVSSEGMKCNIVRLWERCRSCVAKKAGKN